MGFSLKGFASGLADSATSYIEDREKDRDESTTLKRGLIYNATESMYGKAATLKEENDKLVKADKQYLSTILSIDPQISKDNQNKLLSLGVDDRKRAEEEFYYQKASNPSVTFGDFMQYVNEPEDIGNTEVMQSNQVAATKPAPNVVSAFYDKTGLISDSTVDDIYDEAVGVMTSIHGFSAAKAQSIISEGVYNVQHPPIKINWSKNLGIAKEAAKDRIYKEALQNANLKDAALGITNKQIEATNSAIDSMRSLWQSNYMIPVMDKDGEEVIENGRVKMQVMPAMMAGTRSGLEQEFRNSPEYKQFAVDSMTPHIVALVENPALSKQTSLNYMNTTFPGVYGGTYDLSSASPEKVVKDLDPSKIYHVQSVDRDGGPPKGYVYTGQQVIAAMGTTASTVTTNDVVKETEVVSESTLTNDMELSAAEARLGLAKELGETDSQIDKDTAFVDKLTVKKETNKFFRDLDSGNIRPSDANRMLEAAMDISETGSIQEIQEAFDKVNSYKSSAGVGQSPLVTNAIINALSVLDSVLGAEDNNIQELEIASLSKLSNTNSATMDMLKDAVRTINAYPKYLIDRDDVAKLKESLLSKIASM
mgnify:CR=1 FL=1